MSLLGREQIGSSVSNTRMRTMGDARKRIVAGIKGQLEIWEKDRGESLPDTLPKGKGASGAKHAKSSLWFKQKEMNDDWMLKIKLGQTNLYLTEQARKDANPYFTVSADEMSKVMKDTIEEVEAGKWDEYIKPIIDKANHTK